MNVLRSTFGALDNGEEISLFTVRTPAMEIKLCEWGARITELHTKDKHGKLESVVLGFDTLAKYLAGQPYFGCTVGRVANRIAHGTFTLNGRTFHLTKNDGDNTLHGGTRGFDKARWIGEILSERTEPAVLFSHISPDGDQGFPGTVKAEVCFTILEATTVEIRYRASADAPTPINLTNHSYFNLRGAGSGDILGQRLMLHALQYTPVDDSLIPLGSFASVKGSPFDFTKEKQIGEEINRTPAGYDHNFVLERGHPAAVAWDPETGRELKIETTQPGIQFYSGNFLDGTLTGIGGVYRKHGGFCLETQHFPDAIHHPQFMPFILEPGKNYEQITRLTFGTRTEGSMPSS